MRTLPILPMVAMLVGAGCATYPENASYLHGDRYHVAKINTYATRISAVDGRSTLLRQNPVPVEPGRHVITLVTAPVAGFGVPEYRALDLEVQPCKRYYIVAERDNRLLQNWRPIIDNVGPLGDSNCH
jgi:hypothetical protein